MKVLTPTFITLLLTAKLLLATLFFCWIQADTLLLTRDAVAAAQEKDVAPGKDPAVNVESVERMSVDPILKKSADLEKREKELEKRKQELIRIQDDINAKIAKMEQLRTEIRSQWETRRGFEEQKLKHLVKAYSAMKPQAAANVIEKLELAFAVEILSRMQGDTVGGILSFVDKEKAAKISEALAKQK